MGTEGRFIMQAADARSRVDGYYQNSAHLYRPVTGGKLLANLSEYSEKYIYYKQ